jgi:serine phosphatase RsbU (regulator of sigma subunit)
MIDWGMAQATMPGQTIGGDRCLVRTHAGGTLVAVVDGLGHGAEAAVAADTAIDTLETHVGELVTTLLQRCHEAMRRTRGAAVSLASLSGASDSMTWLGVGNVEAVVLRANKEAVPAREYIRLFPGVVGYHLPSVRAAVTPLTPGDLVIFFTDGVRSDFLSEPIVGLSPQQIAHRICAKHCKPSDDALILVAHYEGMG